MANLIEDPGEIVAMLAGTRRMAILGIKPEFRSPKPAYTVPKYLQAEGYHIIPVPVYYPAVTEILGQPVYRTIAEIPAPVDLVVVFRRSHDIPAHLADLLAAKPSGVWFQLGIRNDAVAGKLADAGIRVVQDRCTAIEHEKLKEQRRSAEATERA